MPSYRIGWSLVQTECIRRNEISGRSITDFTDCGKRAEADAPGHIPDHVRTLDVLASRAPRSGMVDSMYAIPDDRRLRTRD